MPPYCVYASLCVLWRITLRREGSFFPKRGITLRRSLSSLPPVSLLAKSSPSSHPFHCWRRVLPSCCARLSPSCCARLSPLAVLFPFHWLPVLLFLSRFTGCQFSSSLCSTALCGGFIGHSKPVSLLVDVPHPGVIPVSLLDTLPPPVSLLADTPVYSPCVPHVLLLSDIPATYESPVLTFHGM